MILAFCGTRKGMTPRQHSITKQILEEFLPEIVEVHHGGCVGADQEFHELCIHMRVPYIHVWPSNLEGTQMISGSHFNVIVHWHNPQPPLDRNWDIVREADLVVACPESATETLRSGTWATVRYAEQLDKTIKVIRPYDEDTQ